MAGWFISLPLPPDCCDPFFTAQLKRTPPSSSNVCLSSAAIDTCQPKRALLIQITACTWNNDPAFICSVNIVLQIFYGRFEYSQDFTVLLIWSGAVVCADISPQGIGLISTGSSGWMWLSSVQPSSSGHYSSLWDRLIHVLIVCCSTTHSRSLHTSIFPEDGWRRRSIGLMT